MAIIATGTTGPQKYSGGGTQPAQGFRMTRDGGLSVSEYNGQHYLAASDQIVFTAFASALATSAVGTAMVGLQLWNGSSTSNLVLLETGGMVIVSTTSATSLVLAFGLGQVIAPTGQTAITKVANTFLSPTAPGPVGLALNAGTFTNAPVAILNLMHNTAAISTTGEDPGFRVDLKGRYIVPPQSYVAIAAVGAAITASGSNLDLTWMEVPV